MKTLITLAIALFIGPGWAGSAAEPTGIDDLDWLAGCWAAVGGEPGSGEQWSRPAGGTMLGVNRSVRNSRTVAHEFMLIRETEGGGMEFVANPSGQAGASFVRVQQSRDEVVFENPEHDFPQRILYRLIEGGLLQARIEGQVQGQERGVDFPFRRISCEGTTDAASEEQRLLALHEQVLNAHRTGDVDSWMAVEGDRYVSANNGSISFPTTDQRRAGREPYLAATTFTVYRDLRPPVVRVSDDGSQGWVMAEVEIRGTRVSGEVETAVEAVWAWIELYEKQAGEWKLVGNVSNRVPDAED